jgi:agmatinase
VTSPGTEAPPFLVDGSPIAAPLRDPFDQPVADLIHPPDAEFDAAPLLSLVGVPFDTTTMGRRGSKHGPSAIRQALGGLIAYHAGFAVDLSECAGVVDFGDVDVVDTDVQATWSRIADVTEALGRIGRPLAVLGGDHGLTFPALQGVTRATEGSLALIALDAHYDVRPHHRGQLASGVPFGYALERLDGRVRPEYSTQIGIAGWENSAAAAGYLRERDVRVFAARDIHRGGLDEALRETRDRALQADGVWLTLDVDVVDAAYAPGVNAPTIGGLTSDQFLEIVWILGHLPGLRGVDVVEVSPPLDPSGVTSLLGAQTLLTVLAARHDADRSPL